MSEDGNILIEKDALSLRSSVNDMLTHQFDQQEKLNRLGLGLQGSMESAMPPMIRDSGTEQPHHA